MADAITVRPVEWAWVRYCARQLAEDFLEGRGVSVTDRYDELLLLLIDVAVSDLDYVRHCLERLPSWAVEQAVAPDPHRENA